MASDRGCFCEVAVEGQEGFAHRREREVQGIGEVQSCADPVGSREARRVSIECHVAESCQRPKGRP